MNAYWLCFLKTPKRGNANGDSDSEFLKKKKKEKEWALIVPGFKRIQAPVSTAEREIKGDATRKKMEVVSSRWQGTIRDGITPAAKKTVVH